MDKKINTTNDNSWIINSNNINKNIKKSKNKINHWSKDNIDSTTRKINKEIYAHDKQASITIKLDDFSIFINNKITRRGINRGLVCIQENLNNSILHIEKIILQAFEEKDANKKYNLLFEAKHCMKIDIWCDIRFLMINKAITPRRNYRFNT